MLLILYGAQTLDHILFYSILSITPLIPTQCLFLNWMWNSHIRSQHFQEWPLILDDSEFDSLRGSLQSRSFEWWNECTCAAIIKIRPNGSLFLLTVPFRRECYCQWNLASRSGSYQKCHEAAWDSETSFRWKIPGCSSDGHFVSLRIDNHLCNASPYGTDLLTFKLTLQLQDHTSLFY